MAKTKKKNARLPLVITGYVLFGLLVVSVVLSTTIPFGLILMNPYSIKSNVIIMMLALTLGAILPVLAGYFIGDQSVKSKSKMSHHFNGVLFGLLAYWVMILFGAFVIIPPQLFPDNNVRLIFMNLLPCIVIGVVAAGLAIAHVRSGKAKQDVLEYKPFSITLVVCIAAIPILSLVDSIVANSLNVYSFVSLGLVTLFGLISYASLRRARLDAFKRITWTAVSVSVLFLTIFICNLLESGITSYLIPYSTMESQMVAAGVAMLCAVAGWCVYWVLQVKALRDGKNRINKS